MDAGLLKELEKKYGAVFRTTMLKKSPLDPRETAVVGKSELRGGDRMLIHGYHNTYADYLPNNPKTVVELGILRGTGLAIWCDVYTDARIIGLDIDVSHYDENGLIEAGAFTKNCPEVYEFDKFADNRPFYKSLPPIDLMIDDSAHDTESILYAFENIRPFLSDNFVYFIEDNREVDLFLTEQYTDLNIQAFGKLTVIQGNQNNQNIKK